MHVIALVLMLGCLLQAVAKATGPLQPTTATTLTRGNLTGKRTVARELCAIRGGSSSCSSDISSLDWRFFAAGGICAAFSHGITTPIDVIKTRMQQYPELYTRGVWQAAKDIVASHGIGFLLAGLGPTIVGYGLEGALKFGFYESCKVILLHATPYVFINLLMASVIAGAIASVVLCPMEEARIKMVGESDWAKENVVSSIVRLIREDGILSSFRGLNAMLSKQIPYTMGKQVSFDIITKLFYAAALLLSLDKGNSSVKWCISVLSAFFAAVIACVTSQPGDVILTNTYGGSSHGGVSNAAAAATSSTDFASVVSEIYRKHGLAGFYLGLQARLAHVASIITSQLVVYDVVKMALGLPVTGSH